LINRCIAIEPLQRTAFTMAARFFASLRYLPSQRFAIA
jgi:hypothetical protein